MNGTSPSVSKPPKPNNTPMPVEENIKYYMFSLYDNSYKYSVFYDTEISVETGIKDDIEKELVAGYKSELRYGSLKVVNDYVRDPLILGRFFKRLWLLKSLKKANPPSSYSTLIQVKGIV